MSKSVLNTEDINTGANAGKIGAANVAKVGGLGNDVALGDTKHISVGGHNTKTGRIGAENNYNIAGNMADNSRVGNTSDVTVRGPNSGAIGSGNQVKIG